MNKNPVKFGIIVIVVGVAVSTYGLLLKMSHESCMEMIRVFERGESTILPLCEADDSARFIIAGLPVIGIGVLVLVPGLRDAAILEQVFGRS
ncbi:MAG TPA: hypothetical protein VD736_07275 [Nitrososphaera sp.]|nr:hypothetical protein [Nitrososphaera sp.]